MKETTNLPVEEGNNKNLEGEDNKEIVNNQEENKHNSNDDESSDDKDI